jgi:hypothetical protein
LYSTLHSYLNLNCTAVSSNCCASDPLIHVWSCLIISVPLYIYFSNCQFVFNLYLMLWFYFYSNTVRACALITHYHEDANV